jgi:hypothetical protein
MGRLLLRLVMDLMECDCIIQLVHHVLGHARGGVQVEGGTKDLTRSDQKCDASTGSVRIQHYRCELCLGGLIGLLL